jgi:hypothetical protein
MIEEMPIYKVVLFIEGSRRDPTAGLYHLETRGMSPKTLNEKILKSVHAKTLGRLAQKTIEAKISLDKATEVTTIQAPSFKPPNPIMKVPFTPMNINDFYDEYRVRLLNNAVDRGYPDR